MGTITHAAERKAFEVALNAVVRKTEKGRRNGYVGVVNAIEAVLGDGWKPEAYDALREAFGKEGKWAGFMDNLLVNYDTDYIKGLMMSLGYEGGFSGFRQTKRKEKELGMKIPWIILFDPTSACNLHCAGCWASEYKKTLNLSYEDMNNLVCQGKELGVHEYLMTGGEPLCRKKDIVALAKEHPDCGFMIFTNGTLIDEPFCEDVLACKNILLILSIEGFEAATDGRRGSGVFRKVTDSMGLMKEKGLVFGTSVCYTRNNIDAVTSDEFFDFLMDFQNDGEFVGGCIAGGKYYCHINPNGDVEPCVFIHYSGANIHDMPLKECLEQPLFKAYQEEQPFNKNMLRPCPMLENPQYLRSIIERTGAKSTDMLSPESCEHLCSKCDAYAAEWEPSANKLWSARHLER